TPRLLQHFVMAKQARTCAIPLLNAPLPAPEQSPMPILRPPASREPVAQEPSPVCPPAGK
ncbi:MAG TPA: hypothetical protein VNH18_18040, partial [Bryobacteraceae bacterium]|nr:hypothetical protein [Bryobacteraceae bacterium]